MPTTYFEAHPTMQQAVRAVVHILDYGGQPPKSMDVDAAVRFGYAEYDMTGDVVGDLLLTPKGCDAGLRWRRGDDSHGGDAA